MNINSEELEKYLQSSLSAIKKGIEGSGDFRITEPIEFDLAVINTKEGGGGLKISIVKAEGNLKLEEISHIKIKVNPDKRKEAKVFQTR
jgi:hypothetical protein